MFGQRQAFGLSMAPAPTFAWGYVPTGRQYRQGQLVPSRIASTRFEIAVRDSRGSAGGRNVEKTMTPQ